MGESRRPEFLSYVKSCSSVTDDPLKSGSHGCLFLVLVSAATLNIWKQAVVETQVKNQMSPPSLEAQL